MPSNSFPGHLARLNVSCCSNDGGASMSKRQRSQEPDHVDYSKPISQPLTAELVEVMRLRILELEFELASTKKQLENSKTDAPSKTETTNKKQKTAATAPAPAPVAVAAPITTPAQDAKAAAKLLKTRRKNLFDTMKKSLKEPKYQHTIRTVRFEEHFSFEDFESVFSTCGELIQPTPTNKPNSTVWIRDYKPGDLPTLFADAWKPDQLKGSSWSVGGIFTGKSRKLGQVQLDILSLEVQWSTNQQKATVKVDVLEKGDTSWMEM
ncbi:hypothetical protein PROFUN_06662 [Planoprotostelium fungivorum]|uniref:Uncharacterized protein n=1 Tax=Planoprotostelium fungivorum TaxID=1890364 RepID=A0A2P6MSW4_9EUKA|nr:hypothetical protein PROFUN_06662 [Planoprotostelium fungivorum]